MTCVGVFFANLVDWNLSLSTNLSKETWGGTGADQLEALVDIGNALSSALSPATAFQGVLEVLERRRGVLRGAVTLLDSKSGEIRIEASSGLSAAGRAARYRLGEGIMGRVVETGRPIVVPQVSREPMFLNRAGERRDLHKQELSYLCVPIFVSGRSVGALGVDLRYIDGRDYDAELNCMHVAAAMMAQTIKADHLVDEERRRLMDENTHLLGELKEKYDFAAIIGTTGAMREVYEQVAQVAHTNTTVVIRGESGTGKEMIAHAIHYNSPRAERPFIKVNCAALPQNVDRIRTVRLRKRCVHGCGGTQEGPLRTCRGRNAFSG